MPGVRLIVATSTDGFEVASVNTSQLKNTDVAKIAAMSSSLSAIGNMAVKEISPGNQYQSIQIESDNGYILIVEVPYPKYPLIMNIVTTKDAILGQVLYRTKQSIAEICKGAS